MARYEHLGRSFYSGIYEPGHPAADDHGFRRNVLELVRELAVPVVRYPGGNFVSAQHCEDGVGPRDRRPHRIGHAWGVTETNQFGTDESIDWCQLAGVTAANPPSPFDLTLDGLGRWRVPTHEVLSGHDPHATNTAAAPDTVAPRREPATAIAPDGRLSPSPFPPSRGIACVCGREADRRL